MSKVKPNRFELLTDSLAYHYSFHYHNNICLWSGLFLNHALSSLGNPCIVSTHCI